MQTIIVRAKLEHSKRIYRDIEVPENTNLYNLAHAILDAFNFDFDHLFAFGNKPGFYNSDIQYELKMPEDIIFSAMSERKVGDVTETLLSQIPFFQREKDKMYFLFDFGDDWKFEIEFRGFGLCENNKSYPLVLKENGQAPEQYPDW